MEPPLNLNICSLQMWMLNGRTEQISTARRWGLSVAFPDILPSCIKPCCTFVLAAAQRMVGTGTDWPQDRLCLSAEKEGTLLDPRESASQTGWAWASAAFLPSASSGLRPVSLKNLYILATSLALMVPWVLLVVRWPSSALRHPSCECWRMEEGTVLVYCGNLLRYN